MSLRRRWSRLMALVRRRRLDEELEGEIEAHLELAESEALAAGRPAEEARREALLEFGGIEQVKEQHRDERSARWLDSFFRDARYGFASIARDPGFAFVAIGVLALGIGANAAMFSIVDAVLLKPLPFPQPEQIVRVWEAPPNGINGINTLDLVDWQRLNTTFAALSAVRGASVAMTGAGEPTKMRALLVSWDYFRVFGVNAFRGRTFAQGEDQPGARPVALLSHATWQAQFGGDAGIVGSTINIDNEPHQVIGIVPPGAFDRLGYDIWKPLIYKPQQMNRGFHWLMAVGRLKPDVSIEQAQEELSAIDARLTDLSPEWKRDWGVLVEPFDARNVGDTLRQSVYIAFGAVFLVLLIACANVANLLLAKGATRHKELAVRAALGAGRGRLVAQLLTENAVLAICGAVTGTGVALLLVRLARPLLGDSLPFTADITLDLRVLAFTGAVTVAVSLLVGVLPSIRTSFTRLAQSMNQASRGSSGNHYMLRRAIVVAEVSLSLVLVSGAVLLFRSLLNLQAVDVGVRVENVVTAASDLPQSSYPTPESAIAFYAAAQESLAAIPGVEQVALSTDLPLRGTRQGQSLNIPGREAGLGMRYKRVDHNYFSLLDMPMLAGRGISERDQPGTPYVMVINEVLAAQFAERLQIDDPVGQIVSVATPNYLNSGGASEDVEIVGIVRNERTVAPVSELNAIAYVALPQVPRTELSLLVRSSLDGEALYPHIREAIRQVDPNLPLGSFETLAQIRDKTLTPARQPAWAIGVFAAFAALLAALGLYGVLAHTVTQQRREIGIRMALGAQSGDVIRRVLSNAFQLIAIGLALGLAGAVALTRLMESLLFGVSALDPLALLLACGTMLAVGLLSGLIPASRAASVQPVAVLREDG